ncbi:hypothetical protein HDU84_007112 [Entophlyctis sp. JEL0112]|nr:hypothetical protein HDU84_007112 [Entophlyctis sp. JEL0112]
MSGRYKDDDDFDDNENDEDVDDDDDHDEDAVDEDVSSVNPSGTLANSSSSGSAPPANDPQSTQPEAKPAPVVKFKLPVTHHDPTSDIANAPLLETTSTGFPVKVLEEGIDYTSPSVVKFLSSQTAEIFIPSYATWFEHDKIHDIEKKALPEFFSNKNKSKTPDIYKDYRSFMINSYRLNPIEYLTVTACRRNLAGDVGSILRIHSFLEQWGLINFQVDADSRPSLMGPSFTGHFAVTADTPRGLIPFGPGVPVTKDTSRQPKTEPFGTGSAITAASVPLPNIYEKQTGTAGIAGRKRNADESAAATKGEEEISSGKKIKISCRTCGVDCTTSRYHVPFEKQFTVTVDQQQPSANSSGFIEPQDLGFNVCKECFLDGRFPSNLYSGDFVRIGDSSSGVDSVGAGVTWSDQETLLLLEGVELYDQDWTKVAEHVGTRSKEACILKFLRIPLLEDTQDKSGPKSGRFDEYTAADLGPFAYGRSGDIVPVTGSDNPVVTVVALLAGLVRPSVAQASARAAVMAMNGVDGKKSGRTNGVDATVKSEEGITQKTNEAMALALTESGSKYASNTVEHAAATALGAAAVKAANIATSEAAEARRLTIKIINLHTQKMALKLKHFEDVEAILEAEMDEVEKEKRVVLSEKLQLKKELAELQARKEQMIGGTVGSEIWERKGADGETDPFGMLRGGKDVGFFSVRAVSNAVVPSTDGLTMLSLG